MNVGDDDHETEGDRVDHPQTVARGHPQARMGDRPRRPVRGEFLALGDHQDVARPVVPLDRPLPLGHGAHGNHGHQVVVEIGQGGQQEPDQPDRPPVEDRRVADEDDLGGGVGGRFVVVVDIVILLEPRARSSFRISRSSRQRIARGGPGCKSPAPVIALALRPDGPSVMTRTET